MQHPRPRQLLARGAPRAPPPHTPRRAHAPSDPLTSPLPLPSPPPRSPQDRAALGRAVIEEAADALFLFDPDNEQLLDVSAAAVRLTGFSREQLLRMPASYLFRFEGKGGKERLRAASQKSGV